MATYIAEAIEIITDDGRGIPVAYANTGIGLAGDGHFYLITDRFGLDGSKTITGDTPQESWYEGILTRDFGAFAISRSCDFVEAGAMEQVSGFNFAIQNTGGFFSTLATNGVYLSRRRVKYYRVTSTDGETFNFEQRWEGVIEDQPFNELAYSIKCIDVSKDIFKSSPVQSVNDAAFEDAPDSSKDKAIPIAIGRVANSPLVNVKESGIKTDLCLIDSVSYQTCAALLYPTDYTLRLFTKGVIFEDSDDRLVGKYLSVVAGGTAQVIRILSNTVTAVFAAGEGTLITLATPLEGTTPGTFPTWVSISDTSTTVWYFQVLDLAPTLIASNKPIAELLPGASGALSLNKFVSETQKYEDVSEVVESSSVSNIATSGHPGVTVVARSADTEGNLISFPGVYPTEVKVVAKTAYDDLPAVGVDAGILYDRIGATYYTLTHPSVIDINAAIQLDIKFPSDEALKSFDELYLMIDLYHAYASGSSPILVRASGQGVDLYGRAADFQFQNATLHNGSLSSSGENLFYIPGHYYNTSRDDTLFYRNKALFPLQSLVGDSKKAQAYNRIRLTLHFFSTTNASVYTARLHQVAIVAKRTVAVSSENLYQGLIGETFGTTWDGRKAPADPIDNPVEAFEHILRNYDTSAPVWRPKQAYVVGSMIRGTADTGHIFVCTTAGTSHTATEPTWTDTAGATYSDGSAAWKEFRTIPVHTAAFDAASAQRAAWKVGRTLVDKKPSEEWYKQLLAQAFLIGTLDARGNVKVKAWRENTTPLAAFSSATNIIEGTVEDIDPTPMRRAYNDIQIRYDWNPGAGKFNKQLTITKADQPAFPAENELASPGIDLGTFTIEYNYPINGMYQYVVTTDVDHGLVTGQFSALSGNADGYDFAPTAISVVASDAFRFLSNQAPTAVTSTSGTLVHATTATLKWKTFVTGIQNYATAAALWEQCRASYLISKDIKKLPEELGDCYWYFDPYAKGPDGGYIWSDDRGETCNLDVGDEHAAVFFARNIVDWTAWQKKQAAFEVEDTAAFSALEIGDPITFADAKLTGGAALPGWIQKKVQIPRTKTEPERFRFGVILNPEQLVDPDVIDENGAAAGDIIDENGAAAGDIIDENGA